MVGCGIDTSTSGERIVNAGPIVQVNEANPGDLTEASSHAA